mmetsp:Transcript_19931/g.50790  ORF Transcript_19931/g.50790 Transcript_19931/m.50790 type:complete len:164 (-) Transcript_19931:336-827(-)
MAADAPMTAETKALLRDMAVRMLPFATEHLDAADLFDAAIVAIDEDIAALKNRLVINGLRTHKHMDSLQDKKWALVLERRELYRRFARTVERLGGDVPVRSTPLRARSRARLALTHACTHAGRKRERNFALTSDPFTRPRCACALSVLLSIGCRLALARARRC